MSSASIFPNEIASAEVKIRPVGPGRLAPSRGRYPGPEEVMQTMVGRFTGVQQRATARRIFILAVVLLFIAALIRGLRPW